MLALENPGAFYDLLFAAASATLLEVAANPKRLGAEIGVLAILHTWGQNLLLHPHRVAISNHRLLAFGEQVSFRWRDYAHGSVQKIMRLAATEFLRRFFLHVLPRGFVRIRHFGFLANRFRTQALAECGKLLAVLLPVATTDRKQNVTWHCPRCGALMELRQAFTAAALHRLCPVLDSS